MHGVVSITAIKKIVEESIRSNTIGVDKEAFNCILRKTHGLLCAHELAEYDKVYMPIHIDSIDRL